MRSRPDLRETNLAMEAKFLTEDHYLSRKLEIAWLQICRHPQAFSWRWPFEPEFLSAPCLFSGHSVKIYESDLFCSDWLVFGASKGYSISRYAAVNFWPLSGRTYHRFRSVEWKPMVSWWRNVLKLVKLCHLNYILRRYSTEDFRDFWLEGRDPEYVSNMINKCEDRRLKAAEKEESKCSA